MKRMIITVLLAGLVCFARGQNPPASEVSPFILGEIRKITSNELGEERILNIYLPEGYHTEDSRAYPVIYLLDGSANEDFIHIAGLVQFLSFSWVKLLPPCILVGIANTDRKRDFTFPTRVEQDKQDFPTTGGSARFIRFIRYELQPFIESTYRTTGAKTLIGQSLAGLLATEILLKHPEFFTQYIIVSPSLWWDQESLISGRASWKGTQIPAPPSVYLAVGSEGAVMEADAKQLYEILKADKLPGLKVHFRFFREENHGTILHHAVYRAFEQFSK